VINLQRKIIPHHLSYTKDWKIIIRVSATHAMPGLPQWQNSNTRPSDSMGWDGRDWCLIPGNKEKEGVWLIM